jgi:hypothetical protein
MKINNMAKKKINHIGDSHCQVKMRSSTGQVNYANPISDLGLSFFEFIS